MSRGSTFTLYRVYNKFKIDDASRSKLLAEYHDYNKESDWYHGFDEEMSNDEKKRLLEEKEKSWTEDIPLVMNLNFTKKRPFDDSPSQDDNISSYRLKKYTNFALRDDGRFCDELLEWNFGSSFDCLIEHFRLNYGNFRDSEVIIDKHTAKEMLSAIEYLLGGRWDDVIEMAMNNPWIRIFSEGGNCDSYWKYVYRHRVADKKKTYKFSDGGVDVTVSVSQPKKSKEDEEDDSYLEELRESNDAMEFNMRNVANALRALLESDNWSYGNETELVLVYSAWG